MVSRAAFLAFLLLSAFVMKAVGEFIHEVLGHCLFVKLFGGYVIRVYIAMLWPYELSEVVYGSPQSGFQTWQSALITASGIVVCVLASLILQGLLLLNKVKATSSSSILFWLSFWTSISPAGYLIIGGIRPFGDVQQLIELRVLTQTSALLIGLIVFSVSFFSLLRVFKEILLGAKLFQSIKSMRVSVAILWLSIPVLATMAMVGLHMPFSFAWLLPISIIPSIVAYAIAPKAWLSKGCATQE